MRVAIDILPLSTEHSRRGIGWYVQHLTDELSKRAKEIELVPFTLEEKLPKADLYHYPYFDIFFNTLPRKNIKKTILTIHDLTPIVFMDKFNPGIKGKIAWFFQKQKARKAAAIITDSESSKRDIVKYVGCREDHVFVVYLAHSRKFQPVTDKKVHKAMLSKYGLPETYILYVGDINYNKNILELLKAFVLYRSTDTSAHLALVGESFLGNSAEAYEIDLFIQENNLKDSINRLGFVPTEDLATIYSQALVYVQPSLYEGFGLPVLEALSCGCPVISSNTGALPEVGGESAVYVHPDHESIASAIQEVKKWNKEMRLSKIKQGREWIKRFSWEKTADETIEVYKAVFKP